MQQPFIHTNNPYDKNQSYYPENNLMSRTQCLFFLKLIPSNSFFLYRFPF